MTRLVRSFSDDPFVNLAIEASLFTKGEPAVYLWQNRRCVICGRNQNLYAEADVAWAKQNGILVLRRTTGGGTVYQDHGNLNYSLILPAEKIEDIPDEIIRILGIAGIHCEKSGRNDLILNGKKFGGTAWQIEDDTVLFHGTLLIDPDFETMNRVLTPSRLKLQSKGVASVKSRVTSLKSADPACTSEKLVSAFETYFNSSFSEIIPDCDVMKEAQKLRSDSWIYGECADYDVTYEFRCDRGICSVSLGIHDGLIKTANVTHDFMDAAAHADLSALEGMLYSPEEICDIIAALIKGAFKDVQI